MSILTVDAKTLQGWLANNEAVLVDVREPVEYATQHIPEAVSLPLSQVSMTSLPETDGRKLVLQCKGGARSMAACSSLQKQMPDAVFYSLADGIGGWLQIGGPVIGNGRKVLPLDRQVQLTIGIGLLLFSLLAWFVSPYFILGTGFFGLGLTFAGATGFCGLARLMALAPWNKMP
ncbi:rhodanese-like domain-containing protein [Microvirga sp. W0021]|uniref:Rhodanese-like domain-containing protein n=1 Tax=Hohaiivirga grylli TaxID=3133970 RepID=A0ABV0BM29_9HYPH